MLKISSKLKLFSMKFGPAAMAAAPNNATHSVNQQWDWSVPPPTPGCTFVILLRLITWSVERLNTRIWSHDECFFFFKQVTFFSPDSALWSISSVIFRTLMNAGSCGNFYPALMRSERRTAHTLLNNVKTAMAFWRSFIITFLIRTTPGWITG